MEWTRAKKYTVIFLVFLNIVLLCLNVYKSFETRLTSGRINNISSLLNSNGITIACSLPVNFKSMAEISTNEYSYDYVGLEHIFMSGDDNIRRTDEYNSTVFISDTSRLAIKGSSISYTSQTPAAVKDADEARSYADNIIEGINDSFGNYDFYNVTLTEDGGYTLRYYEKAKGRNVFSNFAYCTIKGNNVSFDMNYTRLGSETGEDINIFAADEALYAAMDNINEDFDKASITDVELGYYVINSDYGGSNAIPFYLITANNKEYYVNAYTGECF